MEYLNLIRNTVKIKFIYNGYDGIAFHWAFRTDWSQSFGNYFAQNVLIFGADKSSSRKSENRKNISLILDEGQTDDTNDSIGEPEK